MVNVSYPVLSYEKKRSSKYTKKDFDFWKFLYDRGCGYFAISKLVKVPPQVIKYHLDPVYHKKINKMSSNWTIKKYRQDAKFRKRVKEKANETYSRRWHSDPEYRKYRNCYMTRWKKKNGKSKK